VSARVQVEGLFLSVEASRIGKLKEGLGTKRSYCFQGRFGVEKGRTPEDGQGKGSSSRKWRPRLLSQGLHASRYQDIMCYNVKKSEERTTQRNEQAAGKKKMHVQNQGSSIRSLEKEPRGQIWRGTTNQQVKFVWGQKPWWGERVGYLGQGGGRHNSSERRCTERERTQKKKKKKKKIAGNQKTN